MKKLLSLLPIVISLFFSCASYNLNNYSSIDTTRVAAVGDSITYGYTILNKTEHSYPAQLNAMLSDDYTVINFGKNGSTILKNGDQPYWETKKLKDAYLFNPDLVIMAFGTNDSKPKNWQYNEDFISDYVELIVDFQQLESHPLVYICYPIPAYSEKWKISGEVIKNELPTLINQISVETGVEIIDLYTPLSNKPELFSDTIHPNAKGAYILAQTVFTKIKENPLFFY